MEIVYDEEMLKRILRRLWCYPGSSDTHRPLSGKCYRDRGDALSDGVIVFILHYGAY
jgi:hypothetical protein